MRTNPLTRRLGLGLGAAGSAIATRAADALTSPSPTANAVRGTHTGDNMSISPSRRTARAGVGITGFAALAAVAVLTAPSALATVETVSVDGSEHRVGSEYTISATLGGASVGLLVYFSDNGEFIGSPKVPWPPGHSSITWKPESAGQHIITVEQGGTHKSVVVQVKDAPLGSGSSSSGSGFGPGGPLGSGSSGTTK